MGIHVHCCRASHLFITIRTQAKETCQAHQIVLWRLPPTPRLINLLGVLVSQKAVLDVEDSIWGLHLQVPEQEVILMRSCYNIFFLSTWGVIFNQTEPTRTLNMLILLIRAVKP